MASIRAAAARDYNSTIESVRNAAIEHQQDTLVTVVECGYGTTSLSRAVVQNSTVLALKPLDVWDYSVGGGTPLWDSVGLAIDLLQAVPDKDDPQVSFLVLVTTDGFDIHSRKYTARTLADRISALQKTDRWSFVFRVPFGNKSALVRLGIPEGNIIEWAQTEVGVETSRAATSSAVGSYFTARAKGATATTKFYADLSNVTTEQVKKELKDISGEVFLWPISEADAGAEIRPFIEKRLKRPMTKGAAFYQLTKTESDVQDYKKIVVRDKATNAVYGGDGVRHLLNLPIVGKIRLAPKNLGNYDVFIQSTSVNRKLVVGSQLLYWEEGAK